IFRWAWQRQAVIQQNYGEIVMMHAHRIPDPIYGTIRPPPWLAAIETLTPVRRMTLIRQLGLKAYIDFPGAIHTRFSHALGVMELAGRITDLLITRLATEGKP